MRSPAGRVPWHRRATPGSVVRVSGEGMTTVTSVVLLGRRGYRDDVTGAGDAGVAHGGQATVPRARTGLVRAISPRAGDRCARRCGSSSASAGTRDPGGPVVEAKVQTRKLLFEGARKATVAFYVRGLAPVDVAVDVVRASDRVAVAHFAMPATPPGGVQSVDWDGTIAGVAQPEGRYVFQVAAAIGGRRRRARGAGERPRPPPRELLARPRRLPDRRPSHLRAGLRRPAHRSHARGPGRHGRLRPPARGDAGRERQVRRQPGARGQLRRHQRRRRLSRLRLHAPARPGAGQEGRRGRHGPADRLRGAHGRRHRVPPALRAVAGAGLVHGRAGGRSAAEPRPGTSRPALGVVRARGARSA
jgi:hypothetical protein